jgi:uncharacterized membrane protein YgcG
MTFCVRRMGIVALLGCLSAPVAAAPRAQFTVAKELPAYFGIEVGRAVAEALDQVDARDAEVTGRVEELPGERVRLVASVKGKNTSPVAVDGSFEEIDALCVQLASKIYPLVAPDKPARTEAVRPADKRALLAAAAPVSLKIDKADKKADKPAIPAASISGVSAPATAPTTHAGAPAAASTAPAATGPSASGPGSSGSGGSGSGGSGSGGSGSGGSGGSAGSGASASPGAVSTGPAHAASDPPRRRGDDELLHPYAPGSTPSAPPAPTPYFVRSRVVAHAIADSPNAWPGAGRSATHALYDFLGRRLRLSVVPIGIGLVPPATAMDEGVRSAARAVVMARLHMVEDRGMSLRCRLEVVVVRDGNVAMRRIIEAEAMRRVQEDPLFVATSQALEAISADLNGAVADIR